MKPQNFEERLIWYFIIFTYVFYVMGILYPSSALLGWVLCLYLLIQRLFQTKNTPKNQRIYVPWVTWIWCMCMVITLFGTYVALDDFNFGLNDYLRGTLGWLTSSALLALFLFVGCLNIRPQLIYRAVCILCVQSLGVIPICYLGYYLKLPEIIYTSSVERFIQNGPIFYEVGLYSLEFGSEQVRLSLFTPWSPALGLVSCIYFFLVLQESSRTWRYMGLVGVIAMNLVSVSRLALICLPIVMFLVWFPTNIIRPKIQIGFGVIGVLAGLLSTDIIYGFRDFVDTFNGSRAGSSQVRAALARIAFKRWSEAPIWGHGIQEKGSKVVAKMPIGSHHTWFGLLFTKGIVGFIALLLPMLCSFVDLAIKSQQSVNARVALSIFYTLCLFSFGEQIDVLAYLCWPGLVMMGIAFKEKVPESVHVLKEFTSNTTS
ncbi:O-antigen ligase family protein [Iningainema tapete]|uniref:O-antigen ligase family protein n=1 Tax=Iningainema tapete BLCC-T55 TaxID=2748662 RepID=A0A8J7C0N1_9CYAN|nr:O-antigen ligase family protein [Iningainema tapete]MBD2778353.1 O-antigen ligase family protein [Iningainema tapete BLCC-T55]